MENDILKYFHFSFTQEHLDQLENIEKQLCFSHFNSHDAFELGNMVLKCAEKYQQDIIILIIREDDELPIFQYVMDSKSKKNVQYAYLKRNSVLETGHCSFWKLVHGFVQKQSVEELFKNQSSLPIGGAFPIYVENKHIATLAVSGLHDGLDHELIIKSLCQYLNREVCKFTGQLL